MINTKLKSLSEQLRGQVAPEMTGLQFLVVSLLFEGKKTSNELRAALRRRGYTHDKPAFSRMMKRMIKSAASFDPPPDDFQAAEVAVTKYAKHGRRKRKEMAVAEFEKEFMGLCDRIIEHYS